MEQFTTKQGNRPSRRDQEGIRGSEQAVHRTLVFPSLTKIWAAAFSSCSSLAYVSFPAVNMISYNAFRNCVRLLSAYFLGSSVPTLGANAFTSTPIGGYTTKTDGVYGSIFVPSSLYNTYITAENWTTYSARIVSV